MENLKIKLNRQRSSMQLEISLEAVIVLPLVFSIGEFLDKFKEWLSDAIETILVQFLQELDRVIFGDLKREGAVITDYKDRTLVTSLAKLFFKYRQVKRDGKHWSPLLKFLEIPPKVCIIDEACEGMLGGCLFASFRKSLALGGGGVFLGTLWNRFQDGKGGNPVLPGGRDACGRLDLHPCACDD